MQVFKTKVFARFARREDIDDSMLCEAVRRTERGLIDADLGGGLIKQRVGRKKAGRSGGYRTLIAYQRGNRCFFVYGFAKNERDNLSADDLLRTRRTSEVLMSLTSKPLSDAIESGALIEVQCDA